jgi:hypothetical protein
MKRLLLLLPFFFIGAASAQSTPNTAILTWLAPTLNTDGTAIAGPITYNVYQTPCGAASGGTKIASNLTALTYTETGFADGATECFNITAVAAGQESAYSNQGAKTFPAGVPVSPVLTVK